MTKTGPSPLAALAKSDEPQPKLQYKRDMETGHCLVNQLLGLFPGEVRAAKMAIAGCLLVDGTLQVKLPAKRQHSMSCWHQKKNSLLTESGKLT